MRIKVRTCLLLKNSAFKPLLSKFFVNMKKSAGFWISFFYVSNEFARAAQMNFTVKTKSLNFQIR